MTLLIMTLLIMTLFMMTLLIMTLLIMAILKTSYISYIIYNINKCGLVYNEVHL